MPARFLWFFGFTNFRQISLMNYAIELKLIMEDPDENETSNQLSLREDEHGSVFFFPFF